jgi:transposase
MGFREVTVIEIKEVLRGWLGGDGLRRAAERAGVDRKTARRYVQAAQDAGLERDGGVDAVDDTLIGLVVEAVRPVRTSGHGSTWDALEARQARITAWVEGKDPDTGAATRPLTVTKITELLAREGCPVPYRTVHRFATQKCGYGAKDTTVRVNDGDPGGEVQVDFGYMGLLADPVTGRRRKVHALIFTAVFSRHMFVYLTFSQTLAAVIAGCEAAWAFFGGVFKVVIPDNLTPVVTKSDQVNPTFTDGWLDYSQHVGFVTDPARVRSPKDKPRVERTVQYVRSSFWDGEHFTDLADARAHAVAWCQRVSGRVHGTTRAKPAEVFDQHEAPVLLPVPAAYDPPIFVSVKVHRDLHVQVAKSLYSAPAHLVGATLEVRADSKLVKLYHRGRLVKTHPRVPPGARHTDIEDMPTEKTVYAMRDINRLIDQATALGADIGTYAERLLDTQLPWTRMRSVYRLIGLAKKYGNTPTNDACATALELDVIAIGKIAAMLQRAREQAIPDLPQQGRQGGRFARPASDFKPKPVQLTLITGGLNLEEGALQ